MLNVPTETPVVRVAVAAASASSSHSLPPLGSSAWLAMLLLLFAFALESVFSLSGSDSSALESAGASL